MSTHHPTELGQQRVYVVDDDPRVLSAVKDALLSRGFAPRTFTSASEMLAAIDPNDTGCVVTDLQMPGMNGMELQQALIDKDSNMSLIMLTAFADVPVTVELMKKGAVTLIEKPFMVDRLTEEVKRALELSSASYGEKLRVRNARDSIAKLTSEEISVMDCAVKGMSNKATSHELSLSSRTVDRRRQSALVKLNVNSVSEYAVIRAAALGREEVLG